VPKAESSSVLSDLYSLSVILIIVHCMEWWRKNSHDMFPYDCWESHILRSKMLKGYEIGRGIPAPTNWEVWERRRFPISVGPGQNLRRERF